MPRQRNPESSLNRKNALESSLANLSQILVVTSKVIGSIFTVGSARFLFVDSKIFLTSPDADGYQTHMNYVPSLCHGKQTLLLKKDKLF